MFSFVIVSSSTSFTISYIENLLPCLSYFFSKQGPAQDVSFGFIIWYIAKAIPNFQEQDQFIIYISYVFFDLFLFFVRWIEDRSHYYNISFRYKSVFKCCYNDIEFYFVPYFGVEYGIMYNFQVYIYFPCINTQRRATSPFGDTPFSSPQHRKH